MKLLENNKQNGFTLIELILVMIIIAILSAMVIGNFMTSLKKGRDARRKQDLEQIRRAVELYYEDKHTYPLPAAVQYGASLKDVDSGKLYMQEIPNDPVSTNNYQYQSDGTYYRLYSCLENAQDKGSNISQSGFDNGAGSAITCGGCNACKFTVFSPNITPVPIIAGT
jgi:prepilin-type N-terminal cleavage/methylation domain-containing protein